MNWIESGSCGSESNRFRQPVAIPSPRCRPLLNSSCFHLMHPFDFLQLLLHLKKWLCKVSDLKNEKAIDQNTFRYEKVSKNVLAPDAALILCDWFRDKLEFKRRIIVVVLLLELCICAASLYSRVTADIETHTFTLRRAHVGCCRVLFSCQSVLP